MDTLPVKRALSAPRRGVAAFVNGLSFPFRGARLVYLQRPGLVRFWIVPILVTALALVGSVTAAVAFHDDLTAAMWSPPSGEGFGADVLRALYATFDVVVAIVLVVAALVTTLLLSGVAAAPFNARLADVIDRETTGREPPPFSLRRALGDVGRQLVIEVTFFVLNIVFLVTSLALPPVSPLLGALGIGVGCFYFAISYVEAPQASRRLTASDRFAFLAAHPMALLGFGAGVGLFVFVPLVNLLFMPAAVAGGVLLFASLEPDAPPRSA